MTLSALIFSLDSDTWPVSDDCIPLASYKSDRNPLSSSSRLCLEASMSPSVLSGGSFVRVALVVSEPVSTTSLALCKNADNAVLDFTGKPNKVRTDWTNSLQAVLVL